MIVEIIIYDDAYPNGSSWKYGFSTISEAIEFMSENYTSLVSKGGQPDFIKKLRNEFFGDIDD